MKLTPDLTASFFRHGLTEEWVKAQGLHMSTVWRAKKFDSNNIILMLGDVTKRGLLFLLLLRVVTERGCCWRIVVVEGSIGLGLFLTVSVAEGRDWKRLLLLTVLIVLISYSCCCCESSDRKGLLLAVVYCCCCKGLDWNGLLLTANCCCSVDVAAVAMMLLFSYWLCQNVFYVGIVEG